MANAHNDALKVVRANTFGEFKEMEEVSTKTPWGFYRSGCKNIHMDEFLDRPYAFRKTITLHILSGEGKATKDVARVIQKSVNECVRILILEHNPDHRDWQNNKNVSWEKLKEIELLLDRQHLTYKKLTIGNGRNILYVVSTIKYFKWNRLNADYIRSSSRNHKAGMSGGVKRDVFAHTSEDYRRPDKLLDDEIAEFVQSLNLPLYSVVGGMMILDALLQVNPPKLYLTDCSFKQALYGCIIINKIIDSHTLEDFDKFIEQGITERSLANKIDSLWDTKTLNQYLHSDEYWKGKDHWRHILKVGKWRERYGEVRAILMSKFQSVEPASLRDVEIKEDQVILYTSTISEVHLPKNKCHVVVCAEDEKFNRECIELFEGKFQRMGVAKKGRDTNRIIIRDPKACLSKLNVHLSKQIAEGLG